MEKGKFVLASDHRTRGGRVRGRKAAFGRVLAKRLPYRNRFAEALETVLANEVVVEQTGGEAVRCRTDHHAGWFGQRLQPCREVGGVADHRLFTSRAAAAGFADDNQTSRDADSRLEQRAVRLLLLPDPLRDLETGTHCAGGSVLDVLGGRQI